MQIICFLSEQIVAGFFWSLIYWFFGAICLEIRIRLNSFWEFEVMWCVLEQYVPNTAKDICGKVCMKIVWVFSASSL